MGRDVQVGGETAINQWLFHVDIWQRQMQYCKAIILQLKIKKKNLKAVDKVEPEGKITILNGIQKGHIYITRALASIKLSEHTDTFLLHHTFNGGNSFFKFLFLSNFFNFIFTYLAASGLHFSIRDLSLWLRDSLLGCTGSVASQHVLSQFSTQRSNLHPLTLQSGFLTTGPPRKSPGN